MALCHAKNLDIPQTRKATSLMTYSKDAGAEDKHISKVCFLEEDVHEQGESVNDVWVSSHFGAHVQSFCGSCRCLAEPHLFLTFLP